MTSPLAVAAQLRQNYDRKCRPRSWCVSVAFLSRSRPSLAHLWPCACDRIAIGCEITSPLPGRGRAAAREYERIATEKASRAHALFLSRFCRDIMLRGLCNVTDLGHWDNVLDFIFVTLGQMKSDTEDEELRKVLIEFESILNGDFVETYSE